VNVVIVGARERRESQQDKDTAEQIIKDLSQKYGTNLKLLSVGCDKGIGKVVRDFCIANSLKFAEVRIKFEGEDLPRSFFAHMFLARNESLLAVGDEYYVFKGPNENGIIEAIIPRAIERVGQSRVVVYEMES
jgi:hypothetical protein